MKEILIKEYNNLIKTLKEPLYLKEFFVNFILGGRLEVLGKEKKNYRVKFFDQKNNRLIHESDIANNMWSKTSIQYFVDYKIQVIDLENNNIIFENKFDAEGKKVYIHFASKAIGDTLAWFPYAGSTIKGDYVCIAPHGSSHAKYWNRKGGWQEVIDYLNNEGYKVVMITQEPLNDEWHDSKLGGTLKGVIDKTGDLPLKDRANDIMNAKAFIGIGSGLSWLAWTLKTPVVLISGFSEDYTEFMDCERVSPPKYKCSGCFNKTRLDAGDWEWCPEHKNTNKQFECTTSITSEVVIDSINHQLGKTNRYL